MKKLLAATLCATTMATTLVGCGSKVEENTTQTQKESQQTEKKNESTAEQTKEEKGEAATITFPYKGDEIVYKGFGYEGFQIDPNSTCQKAWTDQIGNIKVEWQLVPFNDYGEKAKIYLNSGEIPDVLPVENISRVINEHAATGTLLDFSKYEQYMPNLQNYRKDYPNMDYLNTKEGGRYGIIGVQPIDFSGESWFMNKTVLDQYNIAVPGTFEEMIEAMRAIKKANPSSVPYQSYWNINYMMSWLGLGMGGPIDVVYWDEAAQTYKCSLREEAGKRKEVVTLMAELYKEGIINPEVQTMSFEQEVSELAQGQWAFTHTYIGSIEREIFKVGPDEDLPFDIEPFMPPADVNGERYLPIAYQHDNIPSWGLVCSADVENPEYLAAYMDQVVSPFARDLFNYGVEGVTYDKVDGKYVMKEGIDKTAHGVGSIYDVWMVGMGPLERVGTHKLEAKTMEENLKNFTSGDVKAKFLPTISKFTTDESEEKAKIENAINTYMAEVEAKFIYGLRDINEWDTYMKEVEAIGNIDRLLEIYNGSETIVRETKRIFVAE